MHLQMFIKMHQLIHKIQEHKRISTSIKGHNSVENEEKMLFNHPNLHLVNTKAHTNFDRNPPWFYLQDIGIKTISDVYQGP